MRNRALVELAQDGAGLFGQDVTFLYHRLLLPVPAGETPATVALEIFSPDPRRREVMLEADMLSTVRPSIAAWATLDLREAGR